VTTENTCQIRVYGDRWTGSHICGKPVKSDDLCGVHAAAKRRRDANDAAAAAANKTSRENRAAALAALADLGIDGQAHYSATPFEYTGKVVVSIEDLTALRDRYVN
jgi:acyl-CoA reductase-like NAD-dependent aldehyde dehydrogenase